MKNAQQNNIGFIGTLYNSFTENFDKVFLGSFLVFIVHYLGAYFGGHVWPQSAFLPGNKFETYASKQYSTIATFIIAIILRRYLFPSFKVSMICLMMVVFIVFFIIDGVIGIIFYSVDFYINLLWKLTWNVVLAFVVGAAIGELWSYFSKRKKI